MRGSKQTSHRGHGSVRTKLAFCVVATSLLGALAAPSGAQDASTSVYIRNDSDGTTVITPRLRVGGNVAEATRLDVSYSVDVWTSASIDIRSSASKPITEQRDEINVNVGQDVADFKLTGGYRFSTEPDYTSHGGSLGVSRDFAEHNTTLALNVSAFFDHVGRVGFSTFSKEAHTYSARASVTQVLGSSTLAQAIYEIGRADGYLSSPYRFIGIGSRDGSCAGPVPVEPCIPEANPAERMRHAVAVRGRRALSSVLSAGVGYRFYLDDWSLLSHTVDADVSLLPEASTLLTLRYRFYLQNGAAQYRPYFAALRNSAKQFYSRDKELSPFTAHRIGLDLEHPFVLDDAGTKLRASASLGWTAYLYSNFPLVSRINAIEATLAMGLEL